MTAVDAARARVLVCGTLAYDVIGQTPDRLHVGVHNVKLDGLREDFGGCAMNIAYTLRHLGHEPVTLAYVGDDFAPAYADHLATEGLRTDALIHVPGTRCGRGITLTDPGGEQFTAFYPGPTGRDRLTRDLALLCDRETFTAVVLATDLPDKTVAAAAALPTIPTRIWCPGQYAQHFSAEQIVALISWADLVILNRFEWRTLYRRLKHRSYTGPANVTESPRLRVIVTRGAASVVTWAPGAARRRVPVPRVAMSGQQDPTGCGDALSGAVIAALLERHPINAAIERGIATAQRCLRHAGTQHHFKDHADDRLF